MEKVESPLFQPQRSGKRLVIAIIAIALGLGAFSWWFRWSATHRAAAFWGPEAAKAIRDANVVFASRIGKTDPITHAKIPSDDIDATNANGLVHLRNALLLDHSFIWDELNPSQLKRLEPGEVFEDRWTLIFYNHPPDKSKPRVSIIFNKDFTHFRFNTRRRLSPVMRCDEKFAAGLRELFAEWFPDASN